MKITDFGVAIVEWDTHLSKWVVEQRRLDVQDQYCRLFQRYIPAGGVVFDIGACIGDHTLSYARMVGLSGMVFAFEPNPVAFDCLQHNMAKLDNVICHPFGFGQCNDTAKTSNPESRNLGACQLESDPFGTIRIHPLDDLAEALPRLDFVKIDAEGSEPDILAGAQRTLARLHPVLLIEVNRPILAARGKSPDDIFNPLRDLGYSILPSEPHLSLDLDQLDILAIPPSTMSPDQPHCIYCYGSGFYAAPDLQPCTACYGTGIQPLQPLQP